MPAKREFSYEYLLRLMRDHPDWTMNEYADKLTEHERLGDPHHKRVLPSSVAAAISRYRETWEEQGHFVRPRRGASLLPFSGIPDEYSRATPLRRLRDLEHMARGEPIGDPLAARWALKFERKCRELRQVTDLTPNGKPYIRAARPDEVDGQGNLIALTARFPGLTEKQWKSLTPDQRAAESARWLSKPERAKTS